MKNHFFLAVLALIFFIKPVYAVQSTITDAEGYSCMGDEKSRKQTEQDAMIDAKKNAAEYTSTYIKSETQVKDYALQKDIVSAYTNAEVVVVEDLDKGWYKDPSAGDCYRIKIKAEVIPDQQAMERIALLSADTGTEANVGIPVAPPPLPGAGSPVAQGPAAVPDVVVIPGGPEYVYMVPDTSGVYFYDGFWFRYYEGYWFRAAIYGGAWAMVAAVSVPHVVVNIPPEYPRYLPPNYNRIPYSELRQHWQEWDRTREWQRYAWFKNEMRPEVMEERQALVERERVEHRIQREHIRQAREQYKRRQQEQHRLAMEHQRQEAKKQMLRDYKAGHPGSNKENQRRKKENARKQKKKKKPYTEDKEHREKD